ncbi:hypothetical protein E2C01_064566 [Portunus trituberculatus]|uniref:Uncharacterized protein n=1 Tax=Portunus trituberculatus TaxID=210409 RepID=A0A5B7HGG9_PORTR|nr:hypothetical protein [Portunus trituberculatus]
MVKISGNQKAAHLVEYKALSSPFLQPPLYHFDAVLLVILIIPYVIPVYQMVVRITSPTAVVR